MKFNKTKLGFAVTSAALLGSMAVPAFAASHYNFSEEEVVYGEYVEDNLETAEDENKLQKVNEEGSDEFLITEDGTYKCDVHAELASTFTVRLPKDITLDGRTKAADYKIDVTGDISADEYVKAAPEATVTLKQAGKDDVIGVITQEITKFRGDDCKKSLLTGEALMADGAEGNILAEKLSAGHWDGQFTFDVALMQD